MTRIADHRDPPLRSLALMLLLLPACLGADAVTVLPDAGAPWYEDDAIRLTWRYCNHFTEPVSLRLMSPMEFRDGELAFSEAADGQAQPIVFYRPQGKRGGIGIFTGFQHAPFTTNESMEIPLYLSQYTLRMPSGHHHVLWKGKIKVSYADAGLHEWIDAAGSFDLDILPGNRPDAEKICEQQLATYRRAVSLAQGNGGDAQAGQQVRRALLQFFAGRSPLLIPYARSFLADAQFDAYGPIIDFLDRMRQHADAQRLLAEIWRSGRFAQIEQFLDREIDKGELIGDADVAAMLQSGDIRIQRTAVAYLAAIAGGLDAGSTGRFAADHAGIASIMMGNMQSPDAFLADYSRRFIGVIAPAVAQPPRPPDPTPPLPEPGAHRFVPTPPVGRPDPSGNGF